MPRPKLLQFVLASCLGGSAVFGLGQAWADSNLVTSSTAADDEDADAAQTSAPAPNTSAAADAGAAQISSGVGLKLPPDAAPAQTQTAQAAMRVMADKSLATAKRATASQQRLGRQLDAGVASWYGPRFQGRRTANGEIFDRYALTAAHKTLPLGTQVVVRNPRNGKQIVVRINDRGPYVGDRVLDLSEAAASALGLKARGYDWVVMHAVAPLPDGPDAVAYAVAQAAAAAEGAEVDSP